MADISNINLPNGENYDIKDKVARNDIAINRTTLGVQCKNLLKNTAKTSTIGGVTFTVNADKSVTVNGTNSTSNYVNLIVFQGELETGTYILSGAVSDVFRIRLGLGTTDVYGSYVGVDRGNGYTFIVTEKAIYTVTCQIASGKTASNVIFKPMLRYADIIDDTYEPYQPSVQEQTPYSLSVSSKSTSAAISYNGVPTLICLTPSESVSSGGGLYLINSVGTAVYLIDKTGIVINTDTTNKTFTITNNTASTYDVYISCAYKKE